MLKEKILAYLLAMAPLVVGSVVADVFGMTQISNLLIVAIYGIGVAVWVHIGMLLNENKRRLNRQKE